MSATNQPAEFHEREPRCPILSTPRLRLRMPVPEDQEFLAQLDADDRVMRFIHTGAVSLDQALRYAECEIALAPSRWHFHKWIVELNSEAATPIGWVELGKYRQEHKRTDFSDDVQLGYEFAHEHWHFGYATEACRPVLDYAFRQVQMDRIVAFARPDNRASLRVLEKLRFEQDGFVRDAGGQDCCFFFLTAERYRESLDSSALLR